MDGSYRFRRASQFDGLTEAQVLDQMRAALVREFNAAPGSIERAIARAAYNVASAEMERRMYVLAAAMIHAQENDGTGADEPDAT